MAIELVKEDIVVSQVVSRDNSQTVIENDLIVPDSKPDILRILVLDGDVFVNSVETGKDRITVGGIIRYKILYMSEDNNTDVKSITSDVAFSEVIHATGVGPDMNCRINCDLEHIEYKVPNDRKLNLKTIMDISYNVSDERSFGFASEIEGADDMQVLRNTYIINSFVGNGEERFALNESLEVPDKNPAILDILRSDAKISNIDYKVTDNKIIAKGEIRVATLYMGNGESMGIGYMEHEIPFTQFMDLPGVDEYSYCDIDCKIVNTSFGAEEDSEGEARFLNYEAEIKIDAIAFAKREIEIIEDAYSPSKRVDLSVSNVELEDISDSVGEQFPAREVLTVMGDNPNAAGIYNVSTKPVVSGYSTFDTKVTVEGFVQCSMLYATSDEEQPINSLKHEIPFKHTVGVDNIRQDENCNIQLAVENLTYDVLSGSEIELKMAVNMALKPIKPLEVNLLDKIEEREEDEPRAENKYSILIYFAQENDTLWSIAKRYGTTILNIENINDMEDSSIISPGQQILIPCR